MNDITLYTILTAQNVPQTLVDEINKMIKEGWQPLGGVSTMQRSNFMQFTQAMVWREPLTDKEGSE